MKIKYTVKEVKPKVYAVTIKDSYDRAMTFLRGQEYYESPNNKFRDNKSFEIWDYMKWYTLNNKKGFTYPVDWSGFNIPLIKLIELYDAGKFFYTPYDEVMDKIVWQIYEKNFDSTGYIIGTDSTRGNTFKHEVCHGLYYTNEEYKKTADEVTNNIDWNHYLIFEDNLLRMGYTAHVIPDEIQAYLCYGWDSPVFGKGVSYNKRSKYNASYITALKKFL
jgi:hypothetical protein